MPPPARVRRALRRAHLREDGQRHLRQAQERFPLRRYVVVGGEPELVLLLHIFPEGVEELDGAYAIYAEEPPLGFDVVAVDDVADGWEDGWRAFHHGVRVGRCWVGPLWEEPPADATAVVIDPGRAFGTGAHATTRLCLELLQDVEPTSLLDVGCGSGVLSVAAAKLGFAPVTAVDVDDVALEVTGANAAANGVSVDVATELRPANLAVMNIALDVVERMLPRLPVERSITSGYLERDEPHVDGWRRLERRERDGWAVDLFERE
ncbi:MAG TPA: 50S ribosomal protein L11 methyltransferase [Gaiellaceae bacterium]|nr:50S ribosomal protein L11 methyltransferase [Gaiellaceae bacterium]